MGRNTGRQQGSRFEGKRVRGLGAASGPEGGRVAVMPANSVDIAKKVSERLKKTDHERDIKRLVSRFAQVWGKPDAPEETRRFWLDQNNASLRFYAEKLTSGLWVVGHSALSDLSAHTEPLIENDGPFNPRRQKAATTLTTMLFDIAGESTVRGLEDPVPQSVGLAPNREKYWYEEWADFIKPFPTRLVSYDLAAMRTVAEQHQMIPAVQGRPIY